MNVKRVFAGDDPVGVKVQQGVDLDHDALPPGGREAVLSLAKGGLDLAAVAGEEEARREPAQDGADGDGPHAETAGAGGRWGPHPSRPACPWPSPRRRRWDQR